MATTRGLLLHERRTMLDVERRLRRAIDAYNTDYETACPRTASTRLFLSEAIVEAMSFATAVASSARVAFNSRDSAWRVSSHGIVCRDLVMRWASFAAVLPGAGVRCEDIASVFAGLPTESCP